MNIYKNARLTVTRRTELAQDILEGTLRPCAARTTYGVSVPTANKWVGRYLAEGEKGLLDRSSRPRSSPRAISVTKALAIVELRRRRLTQAWHVGNDDPITGGKAGDHRCPVDPAALDPAMEQHERRTRPGFEHGRGDAADVEMPGPDRNAFQEFAADAGGGPTVA